MNEIYIYGTIYEGDADIFAHELTAETKLVRLNSPGGSIFDALAIGNLIRERGMNVSIDGLAASAASLVAICGKHVSMASNGLMMLHEPSVFLSDSLNRDELSKVQSSLETVREVVLETYKVRADVEELVKTETWLSAERALELKLIDEITPAVDMEMRGGHLFLNNLEVNMSIDEKYMKSVRAAELNRIRGLQALKCSNAAVNAVVDVAMGRGSSVADVQAYIDAIKKVPSADISATIVDQMKSGAENVTGSTSPSAEELKKLQMKRVVDFANGVI